MRSRTSIFIGVSIILIALALLFDGMGILPDISFLKGVSIVEMIFSVILAIVCIDGISKLRFTQIFFSLAIIAIILKEHLNIANTSSWVILLIALLLSIGFGLIFKKNKYRHGFYRNWDYDESCTSSKDFVNDSIKNEFNEDSENVYCRVNFGELTKYVKSETFVEGTFECAMGELNVYFNECKMKEKTATIRVKVSMGDAKIFIPRDWKVISDVDVTLGDVKIKGESYNNEDACILRIAGNVSLGDLKVIYL